MHFVNSHDLIRNVKENLAEDLDLPFEYQSLFYKG